jgi:transcriptional regulator with XRE-family HTH domain
MAKDSVLVALGKRVRALRKEAKLTQEELAARSGLSTNYVGEVERGQRNPGITALVALARGLEVTVTRLLEGIELT